MSSGYIMQLEAKATEYEATITRLHAEAAELRAELDKMRQERGAALDNWHMTHGMLLNSREHAVKVEADLDSAKAEVERVREEKDAWKNACMRLQDTVGEQQYTLNSLGWQDDERCTWSKAGARKHQYDAVELAMKDVSLLAEGHTQDSLLIKKLLEIKDKARRTCFVGHSVGCKCWCCEVVSLCDALAPAPQAQEGGGQ